MYGQNFTCFCCFSGSGLRNKAINSRHQLLNFYYCRATSVNWHPAPTSIRTEADNVNISLRCKWNYRGLYFDDDQLLEFCPVQDELLTVLFSRSTAGELLTVQAKVFCSEGRTF